MEPLLPLELEREIFETAATRNIELIPTLLQVCRRVHAWVEPLLYQVLLFSNLDDPQFIAAKCKPVKFLQNAVRHVFFTLNPRRRTEIEKFLFVCSGIESLSINGEFDSRLLPVLDRMRLRKLNVVLGDSATASQWAKSTLNHPLFLSVTHLDVYLRAVSSSWDDWSQLASLPALTHLCLSRDMCTDILRPVLAHCPRLLVVVAAFVAVFWNVQSEAGTAAEFAQSLTITDPRVVVMLVVDFKKDWENDARGGDDFWARAEAFVARKRRGEIESTHFL